MSSFLNSIMETPILLNGIVGWWTFDIDSGTIINDSSINNNNGTFVGTSVFISGMNSGKAISLNGTNYISFTGSTLSSLDAHDKSISIWIKVSSYPTNPVALVDKDNGGAGWGFWLQSNGKPWWWYWSTTNNDLKDTGSNAVQLNQWSHVVATWNYLSKTVTFYINGVFNSAITGALVEGPTSSNSIFSIGCLRTNSFIFNGAIDNVRIYNRVLTSPEITLLYQSGS